MSSSEDERDKQLFTARPPAGSDAADVYSASTVASQAPADLLDLVRSAEEAATVATSRRPQVGPPPAKEKESEGRQSEGQGGEGAKEEEFVDVDGEAIDAPPSLPPFRSPTPAQELKVQSLPESSNEDGERISAVPASTITKKTPVPTPATTPRPSPKLERVERSTFPPAASILFVLALAIGVLFLVTR